MSKSVIRATLGVGILLLSAGLMSCTPRTDGITPLEPPTGVSSTSSSVGTPPDTMVVTPSVTPYPLATTVQEAAAENLPLYPGARNVQEEFWGSVTPPRREITYEIDATAKLDVLTYYHQILLADGWTTPDQDWARYPASFVWSDPMGATPWRLFLLVGGFITNSGGNAVELTLIRWPDGNKVPLYPGAQQVTTSTGKTTCQFVARMITYVTSASPAQVEAYYKDVLSQQGWWIVEPMCTLPGLNYIFRLGTPEHVVGEYLTVNITGGANSLTKVELTVSGDGVTE